MTEEFDLKAEIDKSIGIYGGEKAELIRLHLFGEAAKLVRERTYHSSQSLRELGNGEIEVTLFVTNNPELKSIVLGWGGEVEVLEPEDLRQAVEKSFLAGAGRNRKR